MAAPMCNTGANRVVVCRTRLGYGRNAKQLPSVGGQSMRKSAKCAVAAAQMARNASVKR